MKKVSMSLAAFCVATAASHAGGPDNTGNEDVNRRASIIQTSQTGVAALPMPHASDTNAPNINLTNEPTSLPSIAPTTNAPESLPSNWNVVTKYTDVPTDTIDGSQTSQFNRYIVDGDEKIFDFDNSNLYITYYQLKQFFPKLDVMGKNEFERKMTYRKLINVGKEVMPEFIEAFQDITRTTENRNFVLNDIDSILVDEEPPLTTSGLTVMSTVQAPADINPDDRMVPHPRHDDNPYQSISMLKSQGKLPHDYNPNGKSDDQIIADANANTFHNGHITTASVASATKQTGKKVEREVKKGLRKLGF